MFAMGERIAGKQYGNSKIIEWPSNATQVAKKVHLKTVHDFFKHAFIKHTYVYK